MTRNAAIQVGDHAPESAQNVGAEVPNFYDCIGYEFNEIILAMSALNDKAKIMRSNFDGHHDVALKLSLEDFAKKAEQARIMSNHLAGVMVRRINRRPR